MGSREPDFQDIRGVFLRGLEAATFLILDDLALRLESQGGFASGGRIPGVGNELASTLVQGQGLTEGLDHEVGRGERELAGDYADRGDGIPDAYKLHADLMTWNEKGEV